MFISTSLRPAVLQQFADNAGPVGLRRFPWDRRFFAAKTARLAQRNRRNAKLHALHRAGDGAGKRHVFGDVLAAIDAGEHQIGRAPSIRCSTPKQHAIGRRAGHGEALRPRLAHADRRCKRQRARSARLFALRRDHPDIVAERARRSFPAPRARWRGCRHRWCRECASAPSSVQQRSTPNHGRQSIAQMSYTG